MNRIQSLIEKYRQNQCSEEELNELLGYFTAADYETALKETIQASFDEDAETRAETEAAMLFPLIRKQIDVPVKDRRLFPFYSRLAAAVLLLGIAVAAYLIIPKRQTPTHDAVLAKVITPGGFKATLTLANGSTIALNNVPNGKLAKQGGTSITKTANGRLVYNAADGAETTTPGVNRISTPLGGTYDVILSDGSHVWLNAGSTLSYPVNFGRKERCVSLTGEAYFEVAHSGAPFKVSSRNQTVQVLGTHFNIEAYDDEPVIKTTLLQGSVKLSNEKTASLLKPGQTALNEPAGNLLLEAADTAQVMAWKNGMFVFNDETIESIMRKAARWYDIEVVYHDNVASKKLWGTVSRYKNITELLDNLVIAGKLKYRIEGRRVTLMK